VLSALLSAVCRHVRSLPRAVTVTVTVTVIVVCVKCVLFEYVVEWLSG
jgi:hypothetical protein